MVCNSSRAGPLCALTGVALLVAASFWQQEWHQTALGEGHQFGRRMQTEEVHKEHEGRQHQAQGQDGDGHGALVIEGDEQQGHKDKGQPQRDAKAWSSSNLIAVMLFIFISLTIFFVYLVFVNDADIRKAIYTMMSSTMSIFVAVVMNTAAFNFFLKQVIAGKGWNQIGPISFPRGLGNWIEIGAYGECIVSALLFLGLEFFISLLIFSVKTNRDARCAIRVIGGHLMAFAGIITAGTLQHKAEEGLLAHHHYLFVLLSLIAYSVCRIIVGWFRIRWFKDFKNLEYVALGAQNEETPMSLEEEMKEDISEAENDSFALIFGFLITQLAVWKTTGHLMPLHPPEHHNPQQQHGHHTHPHNDHGHEQHQVYIMLAFFAVAIALLAFFAVLDKAFASVLNSHDPTNWKSTIKQCGPLTSLMTACWIALLAATWQVELWLDHTPLNSHAVVEVFSAFFLTIVAVMCIYCLDKLGDLLKREIESDSNNLIKCIRSQDPQVKTVKLITKVVRKIIEAFGVLVGLSWEKACHGALDTVIESIPAFEARPVISSLFVASVLSLYILPAWYRHILPMSNKSAEEHETSITIALMHRLYREGRIKDYLSPSKEQQEKVGRIKDYLSPSKEQQEKVVQDRKKRFNKALQQLKNMEDELRKDLGLGE